MSGFSNQGWLARFSQLGDKAEGAFEHFAKQNMIEIVRFGFNRPPFKRFAQLPEFLRYAPDYLVEDRQNVLNASLHTFVECKGSGGKNVKIKPTTLAHADEWNNILPLVFFIYNSKTDHIQIVPNQDMQRIVEGRELKKFESDNNEYYEIALDEF